MVVCCLAHSSNATQYKFGNAVVAPYTVSPQSPNLNPISVIPGDQRVAVNAEEDAQRIRDWLGVITLALPLALIVVVLFKLQRTIEGQAQLKVLDFADSGVDDEDTLRRARLASAFLGNELPVGSCQIGRERKPLIMRRVSAASQKNLWIRVRVCGVLCPARTVRRTLEEPGPASPSRWLA